ncbi:hypothetical protein [uncultured Dokdonia sp.]|uniref:hypothetical protein n=1 Tax=uncultured Dokdonia sp. TaxID=575653 RepID=UPI002633DE55|nr:hypothetical protein [uncultured Dokdonia sp.]
MKSVAELMRIIDTTFYPVDGPNHCHEAYHNDAGEVFDNPITNFFIALAAVIIIALILYFLSVIRVVKKKKIERDKNLHKRLERSHLILNSTIEELKKHEIDFDTKAYKESIDKLNTENETMKTILKIS